MYHALLCDPPYELAFMGRDWDSSGVSFDPAMWEGLKEFLYPGAFGLAFASSRGYHRMATAIEDAGFIIHPTIFCWVFGGGFPKATKVLLETSFDGHRYGLQSLKPAVEPIILFQKPYLGKPIDNILATGAGTLNIDDSRIQSSDLESRHVAATEARSGGYEGNVDGSLKKEWFYDGSKGRWPANLALVHLLQCTDKECGEGCPVRELADQSGESQATPGKYRPAPNYKNKVYNRGMGGTVTPDNQYDDSGTAARYFFQAFWNYDVYEQLVAADRAKYVAKASRRERDAGLEDLPLRFMRNALTTHDGTGNFRGVDGKALAMVRNPHPTIKPIALTKWLATLLLPPPSYERRLLVPFSGAGSEVIGAMLSGWDHVTGIEMDEESVRISQKRIEWWSTIMEQLGDNTVSKILQYAPPPHKPEKPIDELPLFRRVNERNKKDD